MQEDELLTINTLLQIIQQRFHVDSLLKACLMVQALKYDLWIDTYSMTFGGVSIPISETGIAWSEDIGVFKNVNLQNQWIDVTNGKLYIEDTLIEHFIVWMHVAGLPEFRKRWGLIKQDLHPGTYVITIQNSK